MCPLIAHVNRTIPRTTAGSLRRGPSSGTARCHTASFKEGLRLLNGSLAVRTKLYIYSYIYIYRNIARFAEREREREMCAYRWHG